MLCFSLYGFIVGLLTLKTRCCSRQGSFPFIGFLSVFVFNHGQDTLAKEKKQELETPIGGCCSVVEVLIEIIDILFVVFSEHAYIFLLKNILFIQHEKTWLDGLC